MDSSWIVPRRAGGHGRIKDSRPHSASSGLALPQWGQEPMGGQCSVVPSQVTYRAPAWQLTSPEQEMVTVPPPQMQSTDTEQAERWIGAGAPGMPAFAAIRESRKIRPVNRKTLRISFSFRN